MKRSPSPSPSNEPHTPTPTPGQDVKRADKSPKIPKKTKVELTSSGSASPSNTHSTPDKKEQFLEKIISIGLKACNVDEICQEFGLTKIQFRNATQAGKKGNLRDKACKGIRGE
ncbi:hypothetical protein I203_106323 [Kwoniella mangroviensis CBS 8507]|uniref:uncharacterized protein n=1 Tax=Kwoniella mangroviensis CBS 8507 TaxID=1296122 RepID=UPI00080CD12F|nr:uncharacterized protein I203_07601 [Kwoniella mangroviensis CBS 8507]OCF63177.1 hypothetical protein I203_07601 [Kwoniella mangroviensis CBS 8507]